jgi:hypothetical protein
MGRAVSLLRSGDGLEWSGNQPEHQAIGQLTSPDAGSMIQCMPTSDQLTIRSIGSRLRAALEREAARRGQSLNKTVLALLSERLGLGEAATPVQYDDLDELAGTWSKSEATRFDEALHAQRQVDAKLWR